jgi:hypothetical protein
LLFVSATSINWFGYLASLSCGGDGSTTRGWLVTAMVRGSRSVIAVSSLSSGLWHNYRQTKGKLKANSRQTQGKLKANSRQTKGKLKANSKQTKGKLMANSRQTQNTLIKWPVYYCHPWAPLGCWGGGLPGQERDCSGLADDRLTVDVLPQPAGVVASVVASMCRQAFAPGQVIFFKFF